MFKSEFNRMLGGKKIDEITLFRELRNLISTKFKCTLIEETHQQRVIFKSAVTHTDKQREISDLWIIAFSSKRKYARMTFLQAKYEKTQQLPYVNFKFKGDYFQYELLSKRPSITSKAKKFTFPSNILSYTTFDSIGSYGIFFKDTNNQVDFAYSTASDLICGSHMTKTSSAIRLFHFPTLLPNSYLTKTSPTSIEFRSCYGIEDFVRGVTNLVIGAEIHNDPNIIPFLKSYFNPLKGSSVVPEFLNYINYVNSEVIETVQEGVPPRIFSNILLINVDELG